MSIKVQDVQVRVYSRRDCTYFTRGSDDGFLLQTEHIERASTWPLLTAYVLALRRPELHIELQLLDRVAAIAVVPSVQPENIKIAELTDKINALYESITSTLDIEKQQ
jgi:uncharacterized protein (DUF1684 family)